MTSVWIILAGIFVIGDGRRVYSEGSDVSTNCVNKDVDAYLDKVLAQARVELPDPMRLPPKSTAVELRDGLLWGMSDLARVGPATVTCQGSDVTITVKLTTEQLKLPLLLLCLVVATHGQQSTSLYTTSTTSQIESEDESTSKNENTQPTATLYPASQTSYRAYQPAAQQRRPVYTAPRVPETYNYAPYSFNYVAHGEDGSSSRQETGDASGRVVGSYTITVEDGRKRVVDYIADQDGFRATIDTNEPGTDFQNPANVVFHSAAGDSWANQQTGYRPTNAFRPRPSNIYSQPAIARPVYSSPYRHYDAHAYNHGHNYAAPYYHNDHRYHY